MKRPAVFVGTLLALIGATALTSQWRRGQHQEEEIRLPSGTPQREEILKEDYKKTLGDAGKLLQLAEELKIELEKNDRHVLSLPALKKTEEIEKLAKRIRERLRKF
jgi:hypothetical protein